jgi:hypothetical protein
VLRKRSKIDCLMPMVNKSHSYLYQNLPTNLSCVFFGPREGRRCDIEIVKSYQKDSVQGIPLTDGSFESIKSMLCLSNISSSLPSGSGGNSPDISTIFLPFR